MFRATSPLVIFVIRAILAVEIVTGIVTGQLMAIFVASATLGLTILPDHVSRFMGLRLPRSFLAAIAFFVFASIFLGEMRGFYDRFWWWDMMLHFFSALSIAAMAFLAIFMMFEGDRYAAPPWALAVLSACVALAIGALWEIFEYGMDQTFGMNMQKTGLDDTMKDLMVDAVGAALGGLAGYLYLGGRGFGSLSVAMDEFIALNKRLYRKIRNRDD